MPRTVPSRRFVAAALILLLGWLSGAPLAAALGAQFQNHDSLPACCRSAGRHHCALKDAPRNARTPALTGTRCGDYPGHRAFALLQPTAAAPASASLGVVFAGAQLLPAESAHGRSRPRNARPARGPPAPARA